MAQAQKGWPSVLSGPARYDDVIDVGVIEIVKLDSRITSATIIKFQGGVSSTIWSQLASTIRFVVINLFNSDRTCFNFDGRQIPGYISLDWARIVPVRNMLRIIIFPSL